MSRVLTAEELEKAGQTVTDWKKKAKCDGCGVIHRARAMVSLPFTCPHGISVHVCKGCARKLVMKAVLDHFRTEHLPKNPYSDKVFKQVLKDVVKMLSD